MRASRHISAECLDFLDSYVDSHALQLGSEPAIAVTPRGLQAGDPVDKRSRGSPVQEISEQVYCFTIELRVQLDAAYQAQARFSDVPDRLIVSGKRVMISDRERVETYLDGGPYQLLGRIGTVGRCGVRVEIDHAISSISRDFCQTLSTLPSMDSREESTITSGLAGGS
jgi:hypothetical protein